MTETEKAWLAGLIDGEGSIWTRFPERRNVVLEIKMTHKPTLERVNALFPGRLVKGHLSVNGWSKKGQWKWEVDTNGTRGLLTAVLPYLVTKREQAKLAIRLCDRENPQPMHILAVQLKALNA